MSFTFVVSNCDGKCHINTRFNPPLELDKNKRYEMALVNLETYWSFPNINDKNNDFSFTNGKVTHKILIPKGAYELSQINNYIQSKMKEMGYPKDSIIIRPNISTLKCILTVAKGFAVLFNEPKTIAPILGFDYAIYNAGLKAKVFVGQHIVNIININSIYVHNNIISHSYVDGNLSPVLYSFFPSTGVGHKIIQVPRERVYSPVTLDTISGMQTWLTDQNNHDLDLRGENLTIRFHLREVANSYFEKMLELMQTKIV